MVGNDWHEAKQAWTWNEPEWPYRRDIPRPAKQSVKSEVARWKVLEQYREDREDLTNVHG